MRRGEIWLVNLDPCFGSEADKKRPVVIVSNEVLNNQARLDNRGVITVLPITSNIAFIRDFQVSLSSVVSGLRLDSKIHVEQIRSISFLRFERLVGHVPPTLMQEVDKKLLMHLQLEDA